MQKTVYLDHNATTPFHPDLAALLPRWMEAWGNPSSIHWAGREPKGLLREARGSVARMLGVDPLEIVFTGGGSEANNLALKGGCKRTSQRTRVLVSAVEHPSVLKTARELVASGFEVEYLPVDRGGRLNMSYLRNLLNDRVALISVMLANNETGDIFPIREIADLAHACGALMHCDAVQGLGKIPVKVRELGVDLASFSGHKFYALKGCGVLYCRRGVALDSVTHGGGQERGRRAGTENVLAIASLGYMASLGSDIDRRAEQIAALRDHLETRVLNEITAVQRTGGNGLRLPNTTSLVLPGVDGETLLMNLDVRGFAVSTGAACSSGNPEPSPTLLAMGLSREEAQSSLRVSLGWNTSREDCDNFVEALKAVVERLRGFTHGSRFQFGV